MSFRCEYCGKFIGWKHFERGLAVCRMVTPDSDFTTETYEYYHKKCASKHEEGAK